MVFEHLIHQMPYVHEIRPLQIFWKYVYVWGLARTILPIGFTLQVILSLGYLVQPLLLLPIELYPQSTNIHKLMSMSKYPDIEPLSLSLSKEACLINGIIPLAMAL